jgi:hypothetical protein
VWAAKPDEVSRSILSTLCSASCAFWIHCTLQNTKYYDQRHLLFSLAPNSVDGQKKPLHVWKVRANTWPLFVLMNLLLLRLTASRHNTESLRETGQERSEEGHLFVQINWKKKKKNIILNTYIRLLLRRNYWYCKNRYSTDVFCNYHNFGHPSSCLLFKTQLNSIGLIVPHRKHITSLLRVHEVNAIYRSVTMAF